MSKQALIMVGVLTLVFGSGIACGLFLGNAPSDSAGSAKPTTTTASSGFFSDASTEDRVQANTLLSSRIRELEKQLAEQKTDQDTIQADRLAFYKKYHNQINLQAFDLSMKVTPEMAELLGLSKQEQETVTKHLTETKDEMDKLVDANTVVAKQTANSVTYDIAAYPEGKTIKDRLSELITGDIGQDRASLFLAADQYSFNSQFSSFGQGKREIQLTWTQQNGHPFYSVREDSPNGNMTMTGDVLQPQYQKYLPTETAP